MAAPTVIAAGIGATVSIIGGIINKRNAEDAAREAQKERDRINRQIQIFESNRQAIVNPYAGVVSLADMATDLSADLSNPFANLGVATSAAEIQIEQADIALANTLDTLQATGASAGGATALANAAKRSKKEVSANIQQQEAQNEKLSAQGEARLQQQQMAEENTELSEADALVQAEQYKADKAAEMNMIKLQIDAQKAIAVDDRERDKLDQELMVKVAEILGKYGTSVDTAQIKAAQQESRYPDESPAQAVSGGRF